MRTRCKSSQSSLSIQDHSHAHRPTHILSVFTCTIHSVVIGNFQITRLCYPKFLATKNPNNNIKSVFIAFTHVFNSSGFGLNSWHF